MSPRSFAKPGSAAISAALRRLWVELGIGIRDARLAKRWTVRELADRAGTSRSLVYFAEAGEPTSPEAIVRLAHALGLRLDLALVDPGAAPK